MRKCLFLFCAICMIFLEAFADESKVQFKNIQEVNKFVNDMEFSVKNNIPGSEHSLGIFYLQGYTFDDGEVFPKNIERGVELLLNSAKKGYIPSSSFLAIYFLQNNEIDASLDQLRWTISSVSITKNIHDPLIHNAILQFASIVLDFRSENKVLLNEALSYLQFPAIHIGGNIDTLLIANIYNLLGEENNANRFLTIACTSKKQDIKVKNFCSTDEIVEVQKK